MLGLSFYVCKQKTIEQNGKENTRNKKFETICFPEKKCSGFVKITILKKS